MLGDAQHVGEKYVGGIFLLELVIAGLLSGLVLGIVPSISTRSRIIGIICIIFNILIYVSPLTIIGKVIKTKSVKYMPFCLSVTCTLNGACWTVYGLLIFDPNSCARSLYLVLQRDSR